MEVSDRDTKRHLVIIWRGRFSVMHEDEGASSPGSATARAPASSTASSSSSSSNASGSFIDMTATVATRQSFDSYHPHPHVRGDLESAPGTPAEEVELRGLPTLRVDAPSNVPRGPSMV